MTDTPQPQTPAEAPAQPSNTLRRGYFGFVTQTIATGSRNHQTYTQAAQHLIGLGLCQLTSAQNAGRGQIEEWVPTQSKALAGQTSATNSSAPIVYHPLGKVCAACGQAFLSTQPAEQCFDCRGVEWEVVLVPVAAAQKAVP